MIDEFPFNGIIKRPIMDNNSGDLIPTTIYNGKMDYTIRTDEVGNYAQTNSCIVSIPLIKDSNGSYVMPKKGDIITIATFDESFDLVVDDKMPSAVGGVTIFCSRGTWNE